MRRMTDLTRGRGGRSGAAVLRVGGGARRFDGARDDRRAAPGEGRAACARTAAVTTAIPGPPEGRGGRRPRRHPHGTRRAPEG